MLCFLTPVEVVYTMFIVGLLQKALITLDCGNYLFFFFVLRAMYLHAFVFSIRFLICLLVHLAILYVYI